MQATAGSPKTGSAPARHGPPKPLIIVVLLIIGALCYFLWQFLHQPPKDRIRVSGRIEGYETNIGAKVPGRVTFIAHREGDLVKTGEILVRLNDEDIQAQLRGAQALVQKAVSDREVTKQLLNVSEIAITQAELNHEQAVEDANGRVAEAQANVAAARQNLSQSEAQLSESAADLKLATLRRERYVQLAKRGAVTQDEADQAITTEATANATVRAREAAAESARKQLASSQGALTMAEANKLNPPIRQKQWLSAQHSFMQNESSLKGANDQVANAEANVEQIKANIAYLNIPSPIDAVVTARPVEPGAVVVAGQTVLTIINLNTVYLRAYIPEGDVGRIRVGQKTLVYLDSDPKKGLPGRLIEIDPEGSFTPENIYFRDDRVKQVFGLKISMDHPGGFAKPGMPADADILVGQ